MTNLKQRVLTAIIGGGLLVLSIWFSWWGFWVFCTLASTLGTWEFYVISGVGKKMIRLLSVAGIALGWLALCIHKLEIGLLSDFLAAAFSLPLAFYIALAVSILLITALTHRPDTKLISAISKAIFGGVYISFPFFLFALFVLPKYDPMLPLGILFLIWTLDSAAYFGGRFFGKRPLAPRISPKKTWEGAIIGTITCLVLGIILEMSHDGTWNWILASFIIAFFAQLGDLVESMLKRSIGIKDSGGILPGHGGLLDRFDGLIFSLPMLYFYHWLS